MDKRKVAELFPKLFSSRHEPAFRTQKKNNKAYETIDDTLAHFSQLNGRHLQKKNLKKNEHDHKWKQRHGDILYRIRKMINECFQSFREFFTCIHQLSHILF